MRIYLLLIPILIFGCSSPEEKVMSYETLTLSGEFIFEGPNTLQAAPDKGITEISSNLNVPEDQITSVIAAKVSVTLSSDSLSEHIESMQLQVVSDELDLKPVATLSPIEPGQQTYQLNVIQETDLLPYLKDNSTVFVMDVNVGKDFDALQVDAAIDVNVKYKPN